MVFAKRIIFLSVLLVLSACGRVKEPSGLAPADRERLKMLGNPHPRLLVTVESQEKLKSAIQSSHQWLWERFLQDLPEDLASAEKPLPGELDRGVADLAPRLCFAWLITGDPAHLQAAKSHLLKLAQSQPWDPENDLIHGHLLQGIALAYDWLYPVLSQEERALVAGRLGQEAESEYQRMTTGRVWYHNQYFQNHGISNFCGLSYASAALWGENDSAWKWLENCEKFMAKVYETLPKDGTSLEGLSYGAYDFEYILRFAELSKSLLGRDYYDTPGLKEMPAGYLHSLVPAPTEAEWAVTFGDAPRHSNWHGPEPQLFLAAAKYRDPQAQWLARFLINLRESGLASASFWAILWYDPEVEPADPATFPTFHHFTENDQVMMRSSWTDPQAMLVGLKCGPFMGKTYSKTAEWDWGTNHQDPDAGSFQICAYGQYLAIDPLYTSFKRTSNHNTVLIKGQGQLGGDVQWMGVAECLEFKHYPEILYADSIPAGEFEKNGREMFAAAYDYVVGDVTRAYHPALGLKKFLRHYLFIKPDILIVADDIELDSAGVLCTFASNELEVSGGLDHSREGYVVGKEGEAYTLFNGKPGKYKITANYLDNFPGAGSYSLAVDGKTIHSWKTDSPETDNILIVSPEVELAHGSRISFLGTELPHNFRLIKMTAFSTEVTSDPTVEWLLHVDPLAEVNKNSGRFEASLGEAVLEVFPVIGRVLPPSEKWERFPILRPHERIRETNRLVVPAKVDNSKAMNVVLLRARGKSEPGINRISANGDNGLINLSWEIKDKKTAFDWDLQNRKIEFK